MPNGVWILDANGNWGTTTSWSGGVIASGQSAIADLRNNITATRNVVLNANYTIGQLWLSDGSDPTPATCFVTLTRSSSVGDLTFQARTIRICNSTVSQVFTNVGIVSFPDGVSQLTSQTFVAENRGTAANNLAIGTLNIFFEPAEGLISCTNTTASTGGTAYFAKNITTTTTTLTLDNGASQPVFLTDGNCTFSPRLAGTNGVIFTSAVPTLRNYSNLFYFSTSNLAFNLSGNMKIRGGVVVYAGLFNSGAPSLFNNITSYDIEQGYLIWRGATAHTMSQPFTLLGPTPGYEVQGIIQCHNAGGVTFSDNASVAAAEGLFTGTATADSGVNGFLIFNVFPQNASLNFEQYIATTLAKDMRVRFNTSGQTSTHSSGKGIGTYGTSAASVNVRALLEDNGLQTTYNSRIFLYSTSLSSTPIVFTGTNTNITVAGNIEREGRTLNGVFSYPNNTNFPIVCNTPGTIRFTGENNYNGLTTVASGTLVADRSSVLVTAAGGLQYYTSSLGTNTGGITVSGGATLDLTNSIDLNKGTATLTLSSTGATPSSALRVPSGGGNATVTCGGISLATNPVAIDTVDAGSSLTITNSGPISGSGTGLGKYGNGTLTLVGESNTFTGGVSVAFGTLVVTNLQNIGTNSTLGTGSATSAITLGRGTLKYAGNGSTTNRPIVFSGIDPKLDSSGTGPVNFSSTTATQSAGNRTITLTGTNTGDNTLAASLSNGSTGAVSISKSGAGKWILSGAALSHTGSTTVTTNGGQLDLGGVARVMPGVVSIAPGGTVSNGSSSTLQASSVVLGGTLRAPLTGATSLTVSSTTTALLHVPDGCTNTGTATVNSSGQVTIRTDARPYLPDTGKVLSGNTVVNGTLRTYAGGDQRGQARYGGNLTFNSGAVLHIGGAA